jgi:Amt family ammonium transporter
MRRFRLVPILAAALLLLAPAIAAAQDEAPTESILSAINLVWLIVAAVLVIFMQAGFAMLETGLTRMKNAGHVMAKIIINLSIALVMFWAIGFALGFGSGNGFVGSSGWFLPNDNLEADFPFYAAYGLPIEGLFLFQAAFVAVSLAIVFGSMLDRTKFAAIVVFGVVYAGLIYPTVAHWSFGGGWLFEDGFLDFAGSSVVHLQGALAALAGAIILGPRLGKFRDGKAVPIPGHSMPLAMLGVMILLIGWAGFNGGSFLTVIGADGSITNIGDIITNTYLAAGAGVIGATVASMALFKTLDVSQMGNGAIAGLVAITAPCFFVDSWAAVIIGLVAGLILPPLVLFVERIRIDDPVGALPAHGVAGIWGTLAIGLFAVPERTALALSDAEGLFYGGGGEQLWIQFYGMAATVGFTLTASALVFLAIKYTIGLRVSEEEELRGQDISEHGMFGYPERFIDVPGATSDEPLHHGAPAPLTTTPTTTASQPSGATS